VIDGRELPWSGSGWDGFRWRRTALPTAWTSHREQLRIELRGAPPRPGFLAGVRLVHAAARPSNDATPPVGSAGIRSRRTRSDDLRKRGSQAGEALRRCRDYVRGWLAHADPKSGLIPRNLTAHRQLWNGRDAAADNYPFMVLTAALTDRELFEGRMLNMLKTERRLASLEGLPIDWSFETQAPVHDWSQSPRDFDTRVFDGSEYVKDGLMPLTEWLGVSPWSERMVEIVDAILRETERSPGHLPGNDEVNGEMMQVLGRLSYLTGEAHYLDAAIRIATHYLLTPGNHPSRDRTHLPLRDHGCELVSGLTEVYAACVASRPDKAAELRAPLHELLDRILEVGRNEHGLFFNAVNPRSGEVVRNGLSDNWGYNLNGFHTVFQIDGVQRYRDATRLALSNLAEHYPAHPWEGRSADGIADAAEGALNLLNREPVAGVDAWIDANIARMFEIQRDDGVIEGWHGDGNFARTALMWALRKQQGVTLQPWRADLRLGALPRADGGLDLLLEGDFDWQGRLVFDQPRHHTVMQLPSDYPRINQFPEWFTVEAGTDHEVSRNGGLPETLAGQALLDGLPVHLRRGRALRFVVLPRS
jgi:hypothetical protein